MKTNSAIRFHRAKFLIPVVVLTLNMLSAVRLPGDQVFEISGDASNLQSVVDGFRASFSGANNGNLPGPLASGRREVNWEAGNPPLNMPGSYFNTSPQTRGLMLSTPGSGFVVSDTGSDVRFDTFNAGYPAQFSNTFSPLRLMSPVASNIIQVTFQIPGTSNPGAVSGFGAVFVDVDLPNTSRLSFYDTADNLVLARYVLSDPEELSFLGVTFDAGTSIARVQIELGNALLGASDLGGTDIVVLDDFIFGEPQAFSSVPEPSSFGCLFVFAIAASSMRRRRKGPIRSRPSQPAAKSHIAQLPARQNAPSGSPM